MVIRLPAFSSNYSLDACGCDCMSQGGPTCYSVWSPNKILGAKLYSLILDLYRSRMHTELSNVSIIVKCSVLNLEKFRRILCTADCGMLSCRKSCLVDFLQVRTKAIRPQPHHIQFMVVYRRFSLYKCEQLHRITSTTYRQKFSLLVPHQIPNEIRCAL